MKTARGALLAFWAVGERLQVLAALTHGEGVCAFVCTHKLCVVMVEEVVNEENK